ncbi:MAG: hypothetical protein IT439_10225 [Phycisphaerales bacterium]|nr:hypothetical protein [Phycisphaerales bacterium]
MGALAAIIAEQLSAKAAETPDAYLRLIESDPHTRWLESPDPWFKELEYQWAWHGKDQPAEVFEDPLRRARWLIEFMRDNRESRPTEARLEPGDVFVRSARVRTEEQVRARLWSGTPGTETRRWIKGAAGPATQLRIAKRQIGEVLSEYGQTTVVETNMVVRSAGGHLSVWQAIWYWDPKVQTWSNYLMGRRAVTNPGYTGTYY